MVSKSLTESGWKTIVQKWKIKDNGLQRALAAYEDLDEEAYDNRLKAIASISQLASALKKAKDVAAAEAATDYLADVIGEASDHKNEITKAKAEALKCAAAQKKVEEAKEKEEKEGEDEELSGDDAKILQNYSAKLLSAFLKLRGSKDLTYEFIVCDAKPVVGLMLSKRIEPKHKTLLTKLTGGTRFFPVGSCHFVNGKFDFGLEKPISGLAQKLRTSVLSFTQVKFPIIAGKETADDDQQPSSAQTAPPTGQGKPAPTKAPEVKNH